MARIPNVRIRTDPKLDQPSMNFFIKVDGNKSRKVQAFLDDFPGEVFMGSYGGALKFAKRLHQIVKRCLKTGTPPKGVNWPPHAASTIRSLGAHKLLNLTGFYLRHIQIIGNGPVSTIAVGLPRGTKRPSNIKGSSGISMQHIAQILEYGGSKIPARPLWRPAYNQIGGNSRLKKYVIDGIRKQVRSSLMAIEKSSIYPDSGSKASYLDLIPKELLNKPSKPQIPSSGEPDDLPF